MLHHLCLALLLLAAALSCSGQLSEADAMADLSASWAPAGWNSSVPYCTWPGVSCLQNASEVYEIDFSGQPHVGGTIPSAIAGLVDLQHLSLRDNLFYGSIPSELGQLTQLSYLDLSQNFFTGALPSALTSAPLSYLNLAYTYLSGSIPAALLSSASLATCNLLNTTLANCSSGAVAGVALCNVSCAAASAPEFTGPCGAMPVLSRFVLNNCTSNGTGLINVTGPLVVPGDWHIQEAVALTVGGNASVSVLGSFYTEAAANLTLSSPLNVTGNFVLVGASNVVLNNSAGVDEWITVGGCVSASGNLYIALNKRPPSPYTVNVSRTECFLTGFQSVELAKSYSDNQCFTSEVNGKPEFVDSLLQVLLKNHDCATSETRRLIIFGSVFGGIGLAVTLCIIISLGWIRIKQRREGRLIDDQL